MKLVNRVCALAIALLLVSVVGFQSIVTYVPLGSIGVKTNQYAFLGTKGVVAKDFAPGWHLDLGPLHVWNQFDATVRTLEMAPGGELEAVQIKSSDGYSVTLDITLKFKIRPGEGHELYRLVGNDANYLRVVGNEGLDTFRMVFGELKTEDFYDPTVRKRTADRARGMLAEKLTRLHVELVDILVRDISFDQQYEQKIIEKTLADQDVEVSRSRTMAAEKRGETEAIDAEADAAVKVIAQEQEAEMTRLRAETEREIAGIMARAEQDASRARADADLEAAELLANGELLVRQAEAEGKRLMSLALLGPGGANYVAMKAVEALQLGPMAVSTERTDFFDVDGMLDRFGASRADDRASTESLWTARPVTRGSSTATRPAESP